MGKAVSRAMRRRRDYTRLGVLAILSLVFAACGPITPATTPPQLEYTPGPPVVVTDRVFESVDFTVRYPSGWRIVTGEAGLPTKVVFVGLDERATITLAVGALQETALGGDVLTDIRSVTLENGKTVTAVGQAPSDLWGAFAPIFEAVVASVTAS